MGVSWAEIYLKVSACSNYNIVVAYDWEPHSSIGCNTHVLCTHLSDLSVTQVTYSGVGAPMDNDTWTNFGLTFNGSCESSFLSSYGSSGLLGRPPLSSSSSPAVSTSG